MKSFKKLNSFELPSLGTVIIVANDVTQSRDELSKSLVGQTVLIDDIEYKILGVESHALNIIKEGTRIGLLIKKLIT